MKYPAQSDLWRLDHLIGAKPTNSHGSSRKLAHFKQVFPLAFFPDELIIEELRIIWVQNNGFWSNQVISIMATDIASVNASAGPFFGSILIKSLTGGPEIRIDNMRRNHVFDVRSLVEGIALTSREGLRMEYGELEAERQSLLSAGSVN